VDADPGRLDAAALLEQARAVVQACNVAPRSTANSTGSPARRRRPIEAVRQSLGVARLSALGTGDGAAALADWAREHPHAVGRLVLTAHPTRPSTSPRAPRHGRARRRPRSTRSPRACGAWRMSVGCEPLRHRDRADQLPRAARR
jgi:pimeloyl-ACP methyl ester carboxylesterase